LAFGANLPLVPVPTLDAMTRVGAFRDGLVCPLLDARMKEVYGAVYRFTDGVREKLTEDRVGPVEWLLDEIAGDVCFVGNGAALYRERILARFPGAFFAPEPCAAPRASAVAVEAVGLMAQGVCTDAALVTPVYLRPSQAEVNRAKREAQHP
jgi:tRNA threonylcarbamoyladenosine biosynthesis protein TsaB